MNPAEALTDGDETPLEPSPWPRDAGGPDGEQGDGSRSDLLGMRECLELFDQLWSTDGDEPVAAGGGGDSPRRIGKFLVRGELGRGGFGVVLLADDPILCRQVALKIPRPEFLSGAASRRRFLREARAASRLDHPNLVPVLDAGEAWMVAYIASAYVEGTDLAAWLSRREVPMPPRQAARLVATLAGAVDHAHVRGILHRDIKPANVLLQGARPDDPTPAPSACDLPFVPRLCDFGLALLMDSDADETRSQARAGSPPYMAPEQAEGRTRDIGPATDVYGLGAVLYELLTGRAPFRGGSTVETLLLVAAGDPTPPRALRARIPRDLETICLTCLAKDPGGAIPTAAALADDLGRFLDDRPVSARPATAWERLARWVRRRPGEAALAALAGLVVLAGGATLLGYQSILRAHNTELRATLGRGERGERQSREGQRLARRGEQLALRHLAGSRVRQAQLAYEAGHPEVADALLALTSSVPEIASGFAGNYLRRLCRRDVELWEGHAATVWALAISPDGRTLASSDGIGIVRLWDLATGRSRVLDERPRGEVHHLAFSPDSRRLASVIAHPDEVWLWDVASGRIQAAIPGPTYPVVRTFFTPDGQRLVVLQAAPSLASRFAVYDLSAPAVPARINLDPAEVIDRFGLADDGLRSIAALLDGTLAPALVVPPRRQGVAFTADDAFAVVGLGAEEFEVVRTHSGVKVARGRLGAAGLTASVGERPHANLPSPPPEREHLARLAQLAPTRSADADHLPAIVRDGGSLPRVAFSPTGDLWAQNRAELAQELVIADRTGRIRARHTCNALILVEAMTFTPDGRTLVVGGTDRVVRLWHFAPPPEPTPPPGHRPAEAWSVAFSPDGRTLATGGDDHLIRLWDPSDGSSRGTLEGHKALVGDLAYSPDGTLLASAGWQGEIKLWEATGRERATLRGHTDRVRHVAFSPDGRRLASASSDESVRLWDVATGRPSGPPLSGRHDSGVWSVLFTSQGRELISGGLDRRIIHRSVGAETFRANATPSQVLALALSPDGRTLASGHVDGRVLLWDIPGNDRPVLTLRAHSRAVNSLAFSADGRELASGSTDQNVRVWDPATGQELLCLTGHTARVNAVAFSPDGRSLASVDHAGAVRLWRASP